MKILLLLLGLAGSAWFLIDAGPDHGSAAADAQLTFYGNGQRKASIPYADGVPHGPALEWHPDGRLAAQGDYVEGQREGEWSFWREDGALDAERSGTYRAGRRLR